MNENNKTLIYLGVALALGVVTLLARPKQEFAAVGDNIGKPLLPEFTDASKAASLEIVKYAEELGEISSFKVEKATNGVWSIPSHGNYPADAQEQMKNAAMCLIGVKILDIASEEAGDQELFGVKEPKKDDLKAGDKGVGLLVAFKDEAGKNLGRIVIGKTVKGTEDQRFVSIVGQAPTYVAKIDVNKLSTKFEDWIEKDLLKIQTQDVERLVMKDYSVVSSPQGAILQPRSEARVSFDFTASKWNLEEMLIHKGKETEKVELLENEELNKERLDSLKNALAELKIVDVFPKPKGLGANLKTTGDLGQDREGVQSLAARGFYLGDSDELFSANGELHARVRDGVEYVLRFGNVAGEQEDSKEGKLNRYLFVMARVDDSKFPTPVLEALPELPTTPTATAPATPAAPVTPPAQPANPPTTPKSEEKPATPGDCNAQAEAAKSEEKKADPTPAPTTPPATAPEKKDVAPATATPAPPANEEELKKKAIEAQRDRITKNNQRLMDKWKEDKDKAAEKVRELNDRFAPWYYVISEDVYKKVHLSRSDILKEQASSADTGTGVDSFNKLKKEGLKKKSASAPTTSGAVPSFSNP